MPETLRFGVSTNVGIDLFDGKDTASVTVDRNRQVEIQWSSNADQVIYEGTLFSTRIVKKPTDGEMFNATGSDTITLTAVRGTERIVKTIALTVNKPSTPTPPPPTDDPIVSVVVVVTRKSGKVSNTPIA